MPNQGLTDEEVKQYIAYFKWVDAHLQPKEGASSQTSAPGTALPPSQTPSSIPMPSHGGAATQGDQ